MFVDDPARGVIRIFTPAAEIPFAGHPAVGTAWLLARERDPVTVLRPPPGEVGVRYEDQLTHVDAEAGWCPPFEYREHPSAAAVDALDPDAFENDVFNWAWLDREGGVVQARGFYPGHGIREDQATGSAVLALCARLDRPIDVRQGEGSLIHSRPLGGGRAEIGGRVALAERREH